MALPNAYECESAWHVAARLRLELLALLSADPTQTAVIAYQSSPGDRECRRGRIAVSDEGCLMTEPTVTLTLPPAVYDELQQRARQHQRRLEDEATLTLTAAVGTGDALPDDLAAAIDALATLDDETLWRVSQSQPTVEDGILLDALVDKRRRQGLSAGEERLLAELVDRHDRVVVLRAEAVALLHARGSDVRERVDRA